MKVTEINGPEDVERVKKELQAESLETKLKAHFAPLAPSKHASPEFEKLGEVDPQAFVSGVATMLAANDEFVAKVAKLVGEIMSNKK
jgi:hypothetical protein